ncbi:MAG: glutamine synthetase family protein [Actinomycetota bacterium]
MKPLQALRRRNGSLGRRSGGNDPERRRKDALRQIAQAASEREIDFVRLWFTDVLGFLKSFAIPTEELDKALERGVTFDGSAIEGFARQRELDLVARPDPFSFQIMPWRPESPAAAMFCDLFTPDGRPFAADPRAVLKRQMAECEALGLSPFIGPEIEFFLFRNEGGVELLDHGTYFDVTTMDVSSDFRRTVIRYLEQLGIPVEESHHEVAPSQHEIDLRFADALTMADSVMAFRLTVKEVAREFGIYASFMPKPIQGAWGSGMHLHLTLMRGERSAFAGGDPFGLSSEGAGFVAGLLRHARAITALTNQWVNSYKRLVPGYEAPVLVSWGRTSRSALVRVPSGGDGATRVEFRSPDPACNPYLTFAVMLAAGLDGIRSGAELPPEAPEPMEAMSFSDLTAAGIEPLPESLDEAVAEMERSELVRSVLGDHVIEWIIRNKLEEWEEYRSRVTPLEISRYLASL